MRELEVAHVHLALHTVVHGELNAHAADAVSRNHRDSGPALEMVRNEPNAFIKRFQHVYTIILSHYPLPDKQFDDDE